MTSECWQSQASVGNLSTQPTVVSILEMNRNPEIWSNYESCVMSDGSKKVRCKKCGGLYKYDENTALKIHMS